MKFAEYQQKYALFLKDWQRKRVQIPLEASTTASSVSKNRVIQEGISSAGTIFGIYHPKVQKVKEKKGHTKNSYPNINFSDTGVMWKETLPKIAKVTSDEVIVTIAPRSQRSIEIMGYHNKRFESQGKLAALTTQELDNLRNDYANELNNTFNKYFG